MVALRIAAGACLLALIVPAAGSAAERAKAKVTCRPAGEHLVYDCTIMLTGRKSGAPIAGAKITVSADMPSMAMAHNVRPVQATPAGKPGLYSLRIKLAMMGDWALRMKISGPVRDLVVVRHKFGTPHGQPAMQKGMGQGPVAMPGMGHEKGMGRGPAAKPGMPHKKGMGSGPAAKPGMRHGAAKPQ